MRHYCHYNRSQRILIIAFLVLLLSSCGKKSPGLNRDTPVLYDTAEIHRILEKANALAQTRLDSMEWYAAKAEQLSREVSYMPGICRAKAIQANYLRRKGNYSEAITKALEVVNQYDSLGMKEESVRMKNIIADTYKEMGGEKGTLEFLDKGLEFSRQAAAESEKMGFTAGRVLSLNQQGIILRDISKRTTRKDYMDSALGLYEQAIALVNQTGKGDESLGKLYNNISQVYNEHLGDYPRALSYLDKAVAYNIARNNGMSLTFNYGNISDVYLRMDNIDQARHYAHAMMKASGELNAPHRIVNALNQLTRVCRKAGQYDSALYYREWSVAVADSMNNLSKTAQIAEMQTRYETGRKDARIDELNELNQVKNQRFWILAGAAAVLAVMLVLVWFQKRKSQKQQQLIAAQSERLQWMMKELHHRVKNNLQIVSSLLNLQSYRLRDEASQSALRDSQLRVQAMSLMHQRLYQVEDVSLVNFREYLTDLTETLMKAYGYSPDDFDLVIDIHRDMLDVDTVMPMGLLVNEIVTNSMKYAYTDVTRPALTIRLKGEDDRLELFIADNGKGIAASGTSGKGFGRHLIEALSKQLRAEWTLEQNAGTAYRFNIPYTKNKAA